MGRYLRGWKAGRNGELVLLASDHDATLLVPPAPAEVYEEEAHQPALPHTITGNMLSTTAVPYGLTAPGNMIMSAPHADPNDPRRQILAMLPPGAQAPRAGAAPGSAQWQAAAGSEWSQYGVLQPQQLQRGLMAHSGAHGGMLPAHAVLAAPGHQGLGGQHGAGAVTHFMRAELAGPPHHQALQMSDGSILTMPFGQALPGATLSFHAGQALQPAGAAQGAVYRIDQLQPAMSSGGLLQQSHYGHGQQASLGHVGQAAALAALGGQGAGAVGGSMLVMADGSVRQLLHERADPRALQSQSGGAAAEAAHAARHGHLLHHYGQQPSQLSQAAASGMSGHAAQPLVLGGRPSGGGMQRGAMHAPGQAGMSPQMAAAVQQLVSSVNTVQAQAAGGWPMRFVGPDGQPLSMSMAMDGGDGGDGGAGGILQPGQNVQYWGAPSAAAGAPRASNEEIIIIDDSDDDTMG